MQKTQTKQEIGCVAALTSREMQAKKPQPGATHSNTTRVKQPARTAAMQRTGPLHPLLEM